MSFPDLVSYPRSAAPNAGMSLLARTYFMFQIAVTIVVMGGFRNQLAGIHPQTDPHLVSASPLLYATEVLILLWAVIAGARKAPELLAFSTRNWPLLLLPGLAVLSSMWSVDRAQTFVESIHYASSFLVPLVVLLTWQGNVLTFLHRLLVVIIALSLITIVVAPDYGIHQMADATQSVHAGAWRGIFGHRTNFGYVAALLLGTSALQVLGPRRSWGSLVALAAAILCLVMARSGGAIIFAVFSTAGIMVLRLLAAVSKLQRFAVLFSILALTPLALWLALDADTFLEVFGKESTLTGRSPMWHLVLEMGVLNPFWGLGYAAGFADIVAIRLHELAINAPNAQGSYMEALIGLGVPGVFGLVVLQIWLVYLICATLLAPTSGNVRADREQRFRGSGNLWMLIILVAISSLVESFLLEPSRIVVPILVTMLFQVRAERGALTVT